MIDDSNSTELAVQAKCPAFCIDLTDSRVLWEAEQRHVPIVVVGSIVVEKGCEVCLCWGQVK